MKEYKVVGLERRGTLFLGIVLKSKADKQDVFLNTGEKVTLSVAKNIWAFGNVEADDEKTMKKALSDLRERFRKDRVDLPMLWECFEMNASYEFRRMVEAYFGECTAQGAGSLFVALSEDSHYFEFQGGFFFKVPQAKVEGTLLREDKEKRRREEEGILLEWLQTGRGEIDEDSEFCSRMMQSLKNHAILGESASTPESKRILQALGMEDCNDLLILLENRGVFPKDFNEVPCRYQIPIDHSPEVIEESEIVCACQTDFRGRRSLDGLWNIAVDNSDTVEVDDSISFHEEDGKPVLGVHIADVTPHIEAKGALDSLGAERFSTLYFPENKMLLFPRKLIDSKLTLTTEEPRCALSGFFHFDGDLRIERVRFERTTLRLSARVTYEQTEAMVAESPEFARLKQIAEVLCGRRVQKGAVITKIPDLRLSVEDGDVSVQLSFPKVGGLVVSEAMILYNEHMARELHANNVPAFYRIQPERVAPAEVSQDDPLYPLKIRWGLKPAALSMTPAPHCTLGLEMYTQCTSPIRRYSDLVIQRQMVAHLTGAPCPISGKELQTLKILLEKNERTSKIAEYERYQFWIYKYLKQNKGRVFRAFVSRILENMRMLVFIPELMQEFSFKAEEEADMVEGREISVRIQGASPRKRKAHWAKA